VQIKACFYYGISLKTLAIYQVKASPGGTAIRMWEWKGADLPFGNQASAAAATIENRP